MKEESSSSEDEDEDEEEEQEEDASGEEEEVEAEACAQSSSSQPQSKEISSNCLVPRPQEEVEPFPEERDNFLQQLYKFMEDRGELQSVNKTDVYRVSFEGLAFILRPPRRR